LFIPRRIAYKGHGCGLGSTPYDRVDVPVRKLALYYYPSKSCFPSKIFHAKTQRAKNAKELKNDFLFAAFALCVFA
jgi:hypothetical protein